MDFFILLKRSKWQQIRFHPELAECFVHPDAQSMTRFVFPLIFVLVLIGSTSQAQVSTEMIGLSRRGFILKKDVYVRCDIALTQLQLVHLFLNDPNMEKYSISLALNYTLGNLFSSAASLLIAIPVVDQIRSKDDPNWNLAYIGGACLAAAIPFKLAFKSKARKAVAYYNSGYREADGLSLQLQTCPDGLGLLVSF